MAITADHSVADMGMLLLAEESVQRLRNPQLLVYDWCTRVG